MRQTIAEIISDYCRKAMLAHPFDADYATLNKLKYYKEQTIGTAQDKIKELEDYFIIMFEQHENLGISSDLEKKKSGTEKLLEATSTKILLLQETDDDTELSTLYEIQTQTLNDINAQLKKHKDYKKTPWQKAMYAYYCKQSQNKSAHDFIEFILEKSTHYLPVKYDNQTFPYNRANILFPSGEKNADNKWFAHFQPCAILGKKGGLLAFEAPQITGSKESNERTLSVFFDLLERKNINAVISLGFSTQRINYKNRGCIACTVFGVEDGKTLNLSHDDLVKMIKLHQLSQDNVVGVHCNSGVGRTGQLRFLFALLDLYHGDDVTFHYNCDQLIELALKGNNNEKFKLALYYFHEYMQKTLYALRQVRYCIQAEEQFTQTLPQFLLLIRTWQLLSQQSKNSDGEINQLRTAIGAPYSATTADTIVVDAGDAELQSCSSRTSSQHPTPRPTSNPMSFTGKIATSSKKTTSGESSRSSTPRSVGEFTS